MTPNKAPNEIGAVTSQPCLLSPQDSERIVAFRALTGLPLDDCFDVLRALMPKLTKSGLLHLSRQVERNRLPRRPHIAPREMLAKELGHFQVQSLEPSTGQKKLQFWIAADSVSNLCFGDVHFLTSATKAAAFVHHLADISPYPVKSVTTAQSAPFCVISRPALQAGRAGFFDAACRRRGIVHNQAEQPGGALADEIARSWLAFVALQPAQAPLRTLAHGFLQHWNLNQRRDQLAGLTPLEFTGLAAARRRAASSRNVQAQ